MMILIFFRNFIAHMLLFSGESRFKLRPDNRRLMIWRESATRNNSDFV